MRDALEEHFGQEGLNAIKEAQDSIMNKSGQVRDGGPCFRDHPEFISSFPAPVLCALRDDFRGEKTGCLFRFSVKP